MNTLPETPEEWQDAVDAAHGCLALSAARTYGLVSGGPKIFDDRCEEIIALGKARGITPSKDSVERFVAELS